MEKASVVIYPFDEKSIFRNKLIEILRDIHITLSVRKIISNTISKSDLKLVVEKAKLQTENVMVLSRLDEVFDEYFSIDRLNDHIDGETNYSTSGVQSGASLVKSTHYFKGSDPQNTNEKAS